MTGGFEREFERNLRDMEGTIGMPLRDIMATLLSIL